MVVAQPSSVPVVEAVVVDAQVVFSCRAGRQGWFITSQGDQSAGSSGIDILVTLQSWSEKEKTHETNPV